MSGQIPGSAVPNAAADLIRSINVPPRPALLLALQREMRREDPDLRKIAQLINRDAAMAGKLLQAANSSLFGLRRRVVAVEDAVAMVGMNQCNAIMTGLITKTLLARGPMMMARFWDVSEKRARGMTYIAKETRAILPELAYNFGLFCDIGIPLLKSACPTYLETLSIANQGAAGRFSEVEDARHGLNHTLVGVVLAENWGIADEVVHAIRMHHVHEALHDKSVSDTVRNLIASNVIVERAIQKFRGETIPAELSGHEQVEGEAAAMLGLSADDARSICDGLKNGFAG